MCWKRCETPIVKGNKRFILFPLTFHSLRRSKLVESLRKTQTFLSNAGCPTSCRTKTGRRLRSRDRLSRWGPVAPSPAVKRRDGHFDCAPYNVFSFMVTDITYRQNHISSLQKFIKSFILFPCIGFY